MDRDPLQVSKSESQDESSTTHSMSQLPSSSRVKLGMATLMVWL